ncbi:MAG: 4Fe-4S dicluster domain-containing protein [Desulfovibrionaceae bacterium]|jgi:ferredoxin|nr:4Fe-4S dicluster domain-containing protein [Desulfovibrionaceae bacterium]
MAVTQRFFLAHEGPGGVAAWLSAMAETMRVMTPVREGISVVFRDHSPEAPLDFGGLDTAGPKAAVFPQTEYLLRYRAERTAPVGGHRGVKLEEVRPEGDVLLFGASPCGARGLTLMDQVLLRDGVEDPCYRIWREHALVAAIVCQAPYSSCFCNWVGGAPDDARGSDLLLAEIEDGFVVEAVTDKGLAAVRERLAVATEEQARAAAERAEAARAALPAPPDLDDCPARLNAAFDDMDFWNEAAAGCIHCGACTYACPTCTCFNITDEASGLAGERIRTWDSCMFPNYTQEAGGHNPRPTRAHRLRNRVLHKFAFHPARFGEFSCTGCGRCIRLCPMGLDIRTIIRTIEPRTATQTTESRTGRAKEAKHV